MTASADAKLEVTWVVPTGSDAERLKAFCCCPVEVRSPPFHKWRHTREWELDAQKMVRQDLPIPPQPPRFVLLAEDSEGIVAVSYFEQDRDYVNLGVLAIALRARGQSFGVEVMKQTISRITERAIEQKQVEVVLEGRIDPRNRASIALMQRFGFQKVVEPDLDYDDDGIAHEEGEVVLDTWTALLPVPT